MKLADLLEKRRERNPRKLILNPDTLTMKALITLLTTSRGWLVRQALKAVSYITAPLAVWLAAQGVEASHSDAILAGITAAAAAGTELLLSYLARKNP